VATKLSYEEVKKVFEERGFTLLDTEYVNSETPMRYICKCGKEGKMSYKNAKKGRSCAECGRKKQSATKTVYTIEFIRNYLAEKGCVLLSTEYKPSRDTKKNKLRYICSCGNVSEASWYQLYHSGTNCSNCRTLQVIEARKKYTIDDVRKMFAAQGKELLESEFKNSLTPMKYRCKCGNISYITLNNFLKGKDCFKCRNEKISETKKDPSITDEERALRRALRENKEWRIQVFQRDNFTCQCCGQRGKELHAHHIFNFADNPDLRLDINNGITLCKQCHYEFHKTYGMRNTNLDQLKEFLLKNSKSSKEAV
jgi:5-methylcytosine-specific restriction endonuclease McrA